MADSIATFKGDALAAFDGAVALARAEQKGLDDAQLALAVSAALAPLQAQLQMAQSNDATDAATIADLRAQLAALTAKPVEPAGPNIVSATALPGATLSAKYAALAGRVMSLGAGTVDLVDMPKAGDWTVSGFGLFGGLTGKGVLGTGAATSTVRLKPSSSTRAAVVPADKPGNTNQLYLARFDGAPEVGGLTFQGTEQGHLYGGVMCFENTGGRYHDAAVRSIPGAGYREPLETFLWNVYKCTTNQYVRTEADGRDATGKPIGGSGYGVNYGRGNVFERSSAHHMGYGHGWAFYETTDATLTDCSSEDNRYYGLNFENTAGTVTVTRHRFRRNAQNTLYASERDAQVAIATNKGSAKYRFIDPDLDKAANPRLRVRVTGYTGLPRTQVLSDIQVIVGGLPVADALELAVA